MFLLWTRIISLQKPVLYFWELILIIYLLEDA